MSVPERPAAFVRTGPVPQVNLPAPVRAALRELEHAFTGGTDEQYEAALGRISAAAAALSTGERDELNAELARAHDRVGDRARLAEYAAALAGPWQVVAELPGDAQLVRLHGHTAGELMATVPSFRMTDRVEVRTLVGQARQSLAEARCVRCGAGLEHRRDGQVILAHQPRCRLSEQRLAKARNTSPEKA